MKNTAIARINAPVIGEPVTTSALISRAVSRVRSRKLDFRLPGAFAALGVLFVVGHVRSAQAATTTATYTFLGQGSGGTTVNGDAFVPWNFGALPLNSILRQVDIVLRLEDSLGGDSWISDLNFMSGGNALIGADGGAPLGLNGGDIGDTGVTVTDTKVDADWNNTAFGDIDLHTSALGFKNFWVTAAWSGTFTITYDVPGGFVGLTWKGSDSIAPMEWSTTGSVNGNWNDGTNNVAYANGQNVVFDDSVGAGARTVDLSVANVTPQSVVFNNTGANTYTLTGSKAITGTTTLVKQGNGVLIIENANTYTGKTTISVGTLRIGNVEAVPHGSGKSTVKLDATLDLNGFSPTLNGMSGTGTVTSSVAGNVTLTLGDADTSSTFTGLIQDGNGNVGLTKTGTGTLSLSGTLTSGTEYDGTNYAGNNYTGKTVVTGGTLNLTAPLKNAGVASVLGAPVGADATIDLYNGVTFSSNQGSGGAFNQKGWSTDRPLNLAQNGAGTVAIKINGNDTDVTLGAVTATGTGAKTLAVFAGSNGNGDRESVTFSGAISDASGSPLSLEVNFQTQTDSQSYVNLSGVSTFTGPLTLVSTSAGSSAYLTLGGVRTRSSETTGTGQLGGGNYAGAISLGGARFFTTTALRTRPSPE